ncbi:MAG: SUF system FeS cluster assembly protein [Parcubacteria group bacterium GW2011_GWD2_43_10]|uniref:NIF system FeS cluster assembly NifU N-terminal domain-containing protein n=5 Tax=Candidatus Vebleniibacteriota TaxID=1817921 RepID=A0A1G2Q6P9_9BACT|nr:MAG: SUF system FeS cluster assembly protein [Parcubacteria group bacterium GW2011_GWA2_42_80]KKS79261.1 MAG: SUF system FeS cluster assembly protein [Parcubacteria group bacterium GW2011_GWD1_42_9]KKS83993.1 MAG: SUF system FeS cluster assembly protein [Parcubacteria group bacterium GW2011_GWD2_43_10]KKS94137.1 MAG: SUF system FeS cluster assembly protein [Parcubacteria group bacterium GW2011_GWE2_43_12]KKT14017.1 MAG: SUF system FeS cluster assembly protein [Parcubacteria group bacterium G
MDLYQQNILDYYRHPRCNQKITEANYSAEVSNPLCGDRIEIYLQTSGDKIKQAVWQGEGCVLSLAAADMLAEYLQNKSLTAIDTIDKDWIIKTLGVNPSPSRLKCALLPLEALKKSLANN